MFILTYLILVIPFFILYPTKIINKKNLPKKKRVIVTSNHYSNLDCLLYDAKFRRRFRFMAKKELFEKKLPGWYFKKVGAFPVDRKNFSLSAYKHTLSILKNDEAVFIFPEGTRNKTGSDEMLDVKAGIITFASKSESDIIPMVMYRAPKMFRKNYVLVGEPFKIIGENTKKLTKEEAESNLKRYEEVMKNLRIELDDFVNKKKRKKKTKKETIEITGKVID